MLKIKFENMLRRARGTAGDNSDTELNEEKEKKNLHQCTSVTLSEDDKERLIRLVTQMEDDGNDL